MMIFHGFPGEPGPHTQSAGIVDMITTKINSDLTKRASLMGVRLRYRKVTANAMIYDIHFIMFA